MLETRASAILLSLLIAAGCSKGASEANDEGRAVAVQFLDELRAGRLKPAWENSSTEFKSLMGVENLRDYIKSHPALKAQAEFAESRTVDREGRSLAEYVFHATAQVRKKPVPATIKVILASGHEGWKVERLAVE
ncbi:hypothetical protein [Singulisphaera sp. PoT]|uniref:hypothetical protein n=1 Tax=Singulisphaera sp. PoT TaxID=3411797 RepID=UPI003BF55264